MPDNDETAKLAAAGFFKHGLDPQALDVMRALRGADNVTNSDMDLLLLFGLSQAQSLNRIPDALEKSEERVDTYTQLVCCIGTFSIMTVIRS